MFSNFIIYIVLALTSFINIVVPISGSSTITPFLATLTDPHRAIGLTAAYFVLSGIVRIFLFRKNIQWREIKILLLPSIIAGAIGALTLITINARYLLFIILSFTIYFFFKKIGFIKTKEKSMGRASHTGYLVGFLSGFLQGTGLPGSDLRNGYLYSKKLSIIQLHGTTSLVGWSTFLIATLIRLWTGQLAITDIIPLLYVFPFIILGTFVGRHLLYKMNKKITNALIILIMFTIIIFLVLKVFNI